MTGATRRAGVDGDEGALDEVGTFSHVSDPSTALLPKTGPIDDLYGSGARLDQNNASERIVRSRRIGRDCGNATKASFEQRKALNLSAFVILTDETGRAEECFRLGQGIELCFLGLAGQPPLKDIE
jgi:hypothetical protein